MPNPETTQIVEDAVNDAMQPDTTVEDTSTDTPSVDTAADTSGETTTDETVTTPVTVAGEDSVQSPAEQAVVDIVEDDFAKRFGLQANSVTGRENRIPYSRVKKIIEKNERDVVARVTKEVEAKFSKFPEIETKVKDYEGRLEKVAQFEQILEQDPRTFLGMLAKHPSYREFFEFVEKAAAGLEQAKQPAVAVPDPLNDMPGPDQPDGLYSKEGLQKLLQWNAGQAKTQAIQEVEQRYKPIEQAWQAQEQMAKMVPIVEKQIADARTWDKFNELEPRIVELLKADVGKTKSLERIYVQAYQEAAAAEQGKLSTDRTKMRTEILAELKKKPVASTAPIAAVKPGATDEPTGPRSTQDVIREALREAGHQV